MAGRNWGSNFKLKQPIREIKMVRFLGHDWVVTNSYKHAVHRYYDLIGAAHEVAGVRGQVLKHVSRAMIVKYPQPTPDKTLASYVEEHE